MPDLHAQNTDTLALNKDTLALKKDTIPDTLVYRISPDGLDAPVFFDASDSIEYDIKNKKVLLFGNAVVKYTTITLKSGYIEFDWDSGVLHAKPLTDSLGKPLQKPEFSDGNQQFTSDEMKYNFKTKKGIVIDARTFESNLYILSEKAKFFSKTDSLSHDVVYSKNAIFTTCDAPHPHYGIRSNKQKVIPNKLVVVGPSHLEVAGVPTPLILPFGFYPVFEKRHAGLIIPQDYENSPELGFGLRNVGYYFPLGKSWDLKLTGDVFMKGSWGVQAHVRYAKRYKYTGEFVLSGYRYKTEQQGILEPTIRKPKKFIWRHSQDSKAHPYNRFSASVDIQTEDFESVTRNRAQNVLRNSYTSRVTFSRKFPGTPFSMTASVGHSQIVNTGKVTLELPTLDVRMRQIYPFKRKNRIGKERWYEKFSLTYSAQTKNRIETSDSTLLDAATWQNLNIGVQHQLNSSASYRMLKYFNFTPSINYKELWYLKGVEYEFDPTPLVKKDTTFNADGSILSIVNDTVRYGTLDTVRLSGFFPVRSFRVSANLSTKLFGILRFRRGFLRGIRHTMSPNIGFSYSPDYAKAPFNYYKRVQTDSRQAPGEYPSLYRYPNGIYGRPPSAGKQMALTYSIGHLFEAKYRSRKDTTDKIIRIFDNISMGGSYNFAADSLKFSKISIRGRSKLIKNISNVTLTYILDPYATDDKGQTINKFYWDTNGKILRFVKFDFSISTGFTLEQLLRLGRPQKSGKKEQKESLADWFRGFRISHNFRMEFLPKDGKIMKKVSYHTINTNGRIPLTRKWDIRVGNIGYDFLSKRITYPDFGFSRNLHCWDLGVNWQPQRGTYSFYLKVRSSPLDFLKLPYDRNYYDAQKVAF